MQPYKMVGVVALFALALVAGCSAEQPSGEQAQPPAESPAAQSLANTSWTCVTFSVGGGVPEEVPTSTPITAVFSADGKLTGSAGVNEYSTTYETDGESISIGADIVTTKRGGPEDAMTRESDYLLTLPTAQRYNIEERNGQLILFGPADNTIARYDPAK